jgi:ferric-dicitrate binding protein FerR (iron transport regulator)
MNREQRRLVHRYIDGLASLPERREVERYIAADPALAAYVRQHAAVWARVGAMPDSIADPDSFAAIEALAARIHDSRAGPPLAAHADVSGSRTSGHLKVLPSFPKPLRVPRSFDWSPLLTFGLTAAAVILIYLGGRGGHAGGAAIGRGTSPFRTAGSQDATADIPVAAAVARGQRRALRLPDGTDVVLGPASRIRYLSVRDGSRTVSLTGEAMFRVQHQPDRPFIVRVAGATLEDLGTIFVARAYPGAPTRVSVASGQVALRTTTRGASDAATVLQAGASATLDSAGAAIVVRDSADVADAFAWTRGTLRYRAAPLAEVAADLGRAYDLDIHIADPALGARVVQYAVDGEDADAALDVLVATLAGVQYERHGRVVTLYRS